MKRFAFLTLILSATTVFSQAETSTPAAQDRILNKVNFSQKLNAQIPLSLTFRNEQGQTVPLQTYFGGDKPVLLNLVYFECPMLCTEVLNGIIRVVRSFSLKVGTDYNIVTVSFDPKDTPKLAAQKKANYLDRYGHSDAKTAAGWAFLTGDEQNIKALAEAVGFSYEWDPAIKQFAHASGIMIATPEGKLSHYFFGVEYPPADVRLSLVEASHHKIGSPVDQLILYCYHYNPETGRYGIVIMRVLRVAAGATLAVLLTFIFVMLMRDRANRLAERNA